MPVLVGTRRFKPATRSPFKGVRTPDVGVRMECLNVDIDGCARSEDVCLVVQGKSLSMETGRFGYEYDGAIET